MLKLLAWLDRYGLTILAGFLLVFIPLYPKIPLFEAIPGYIVRVRIEDFAILFTVVVWFIQFLRKKVKLHPLMTKLIVIYAVVGLLSSLSAMFVTKTVPLSDLHVLKLFLHYFRRLEYFSLFFVFFSAIKSMKEVKIFLGLSIATVLAVSLYGFGQKYLYWPVYSTMNREFSKGWRLVLTEHARVPSTFGGHYDAAAYIMVFITLMLALVWFVKNKWVKLTALLAYLTGFWLLILTASRTSFIAYLGSITVLAALSIMVKGWRWPIPRYLITLAFSLFVMMSFGDLAERYAQVIGIDKIKTRFKETFMSAKVERPADTIAMEDIVTTPSDTPPTPVKDLPGDVYEDIPDIVPIVDEDGVPTGEVKEVPRTYSENAEKYGLSAAIRLDALWPRALAGFKSNPLLGSGYSTLTKEAVGVFTEAESTDNDYLRTLGETGLLGVISFFAVVIVPMYLALKHLRTSKDILVRAVLIGYIGGSVGLLLNAIYIDVYEASKVALTFWALTGIVLAIIGMEDKNWKIKDEKQPN